jgi:hypothetical protein
MLFISFKKHGCRGLDHMVVGFKKTTYAISPYHRCELVSSTGEVYLI